ncbi:MAG: hypothetical protein R2864_12275 [Syntrophotaleaceae bacterium]
MSLTGTIERLPVQVEQKTAKDQRVERKEQDMKPCELCEEQAKKSRSGKPHENLSKVDESRLFKGHNKRSFEEQDYQCLTCQARFTHSTNKNDHAWTLWRG